MQSFSFRHPHTENYGMGLAIDSIYSELHLIEQCVNDQDQRHLQPEIDLLKDSIEQFHQGSAEATEYLSEHGEDLLSSLHMKLRHNKFSHTDFNAITIDARKKLRGAKHRELKNS